MKNIKDLGEKVAIQCKTQEEWDYIVKTYNLRCVRNNPDINIHFIDPTDGIFTLGFVKNNNYTIHQASDFMPTPQDEIKELKARIATLEETLRPKKKIEFVKYLNSNMVVESDPSSPESCVNIKVLCSYNGYDIMKAWDDDENSFAIFLGHFNDGEK